MAVREAEYIRTRDGLSILIHHDRIYNEVQFACKQDVVWMEAWKSFVLESMIKQMSNSSAFLQPNFQDVAQRKQLP